MSTETKKTIPYRGMIIEIIDEGRQYQFSRFRVYAKKLDGSLIDNFDEGEYFDTFAEAEEYGKDCINEFFTAR